MSTFQGRVAHANARKIKMLRSVPVRTKEGGVKPLRGVSLTLMTSKASQH